MFFPRLAIHASCRLALAITPPQRPLRYNRTVMARRSRKRKLKAASPPTIRSNSETPASPSKIPRDSEKVANRSEEHTSELQSRSDLVCRLLLEKKNEILE